MSDNAERALALASLGLHVFPCFESGEHFKAPRTEHGFLEATLDPAQIRGWWSATPEAEIGVACGASGLVVEDIDHKPDKDGLASLRNRGLEPDRETWWYETPSGGFHFIHLAPPGVPGPTQNHKLEDGTKLMGVDRRSGGSYFIWWDEAWPDERSSFTPAPDWFLNHTGTEGDGWGGTLGEWLATVGAGTMSPLMRSALDKIPREDFGRGELFTRLTHIIRLATVDGEPGAGEALETLKQEWLRGPWNQPKFQAEWNVSLGNAVQSNGGVRAQAEPKVAERTAISDYSFFDQSETLMQIRAWAMGLEVNPWACLAMALTRLSADLMPTIKLPGIGAFAEGSLNLFTVLSAPSGGGKTAIISSHEQRMRKRPRPDPSPRFPLGTGEGIAARYIRRQKITAEMRKADPTLDPHAEYVDRRITWQALAIVDEIDMIAALARRSGATLLSTLKTAWMSDDLGNGNATQELDRQVPAHSYRLCMIVGAQPGRAEILLDKDAEAGGLMQRFLFATVGDPHASMDAPFMPEPPPLVYKISDNIPFDRRFGSDTFEPHPDKGWVFTYDPGVVIEVLRTLRAIRQEREDSRHGHRNFLKLRVAALLAIMHGGDSVTRHWFDQAEYVMAHSDATLSALIDVQRQSKRAEDAAKGMGDAERALAGEVSILHKTSDRVIEILRRDPGLPISHIRRMLTKSMHENLDAALHLLVEQGRVRKEDVNSAKSQKPAARYYPM